MKCFYQNNVEVEQPLPKKDEDMLKRNRRKGNEAKMGSTLQGLLPTTIDLTPRKIWIFLISRKASTKTISWSLLTEDGKKLVMWRAGCFDRGRWGTGFVSPQIRFSIRTCRRPCLDWYHNVAFDTCRLSSRIADLFRFTLALVFHHGYFW